MKTKNTMKTTAYCIFFMIAGALGVMAQNPAIHWTFDNVAGSNIADDSGNGKSGTIIGNINTVSGKLGNAVDFNNSGCVVQEQTTSMSSDFTVSV
ncbi:MAG: hypothetical protein LBK22_02170, partial [Tannerella sp.]|nr:hypothetical protein [Tannerella sp.]